ncbi:hypothetical protein HG535_0E01800 [Zygotorulaspora mrakii]|uniref:Endoplasmic reticulum-Golgi intermediate compartment protein n=1 Tax=Zygotorulaspora mrakii TaxID=42260 RepID=A0A7H9B3R9_ZYGMR|nr:uncharacterized protein HG535_0E01800 [Zygotorulaspora mrakii]QLG73096.1 hypothetical protein HG535_0E01800 [Zygotorulaspora mrakii]
MHSVCFQHSDAFCLQLNTNNSWNHIAKTDETYKKKSAKGGLGSLFTYFVLLFMAWTEFGSYFGGYVDQQYRVDGEVRETFQINMDISVKTPCKWLQVNVRDETFDRKLVSKELVLEDMIFFVPGHAKLNDMKSIVSPNMDTILGEAIPARFRDTPSSELSGGDGCHIFGSIPVNRVSGELHITAKGMGYRDSQKAPISEVDFSHVFNEFSYGVFYPYINNPLDNTARLSDANTLVAYRYDTSIVPTVYEKLGAIVDTNQFAVSERHYTLNGHGSTRGISAPGIFIKYDFEPLSIVIRDERISFFQFVVRLVAVLSFIVYIASWIFIILDTALVSVLGPKWSLRYQTDSPSRNILD